MIGKKKNKTLFDRRLYESCVEEPEMVLTFWEKKKKSKRKKIEMKEDWENVAAG